MNDLILNEMMKLLDEYDYDYSQSALEAIINEWEGAKAELIQLFKKHPNYVEGKFLIAFDANYEREINVDAIYGFRYWLKRTQSEILDKIPDAVKNRREDETLIFPRQIYYYLDDLGCRCNQRTINEEHAKLLNDILPEIHPHAGEKTSRVINRLCNYLGWGALPEYNREYAKFADALSPLVIKRHTILSLNPLDYLTMSFGNSWASCHTIDKHNRRGMPNSYEGQYSSGTMSYMLDSTSMVLYTVDASYNDTDYWTQPKIIRQMFHWGENMLIQSRLYPQCNDGSDDAYTPYRNIVQAIMAQCLDIPNLWTMKRGALNYEVVCSYGTHYRDYECFSGTTLSRPKGTDNYGAVITIGSTPICIECGCEHEISGNINCCHGGYYCTCCGERITRDDDVIWVHGNPYCCDCVIWCDRCEEYESSNNCTWIESEHRYICNYCRDHNYVKCDKCGEWFYGDYTRWIESENRNVCDYCFNEYYTECEHCGEYFSNDNIYENDDGEYLCESCMKEWKKEQENNEEEV